MIILGPSQVPASVMAMGASTTQLGLHVLVHQGW